MAEQITLQQPIQYKWGEELIVTTAGRVIFNAEVDRALMEALGIAVPTGGHLLAPMATRHAERMCLRNDLALGRTDEHRQAKEQMRRDMGLD